MRIDRRVQCADHVDDMVVVAAGRKEPSSYEWYGVRHVSRSSSAAACRWQKELCV
jgi:hypothetical protein